MTNIQSNTPPQEKRRFSPRRRSELLWAYIFIAPTVLGLSIFLIGPIFYSFYMSLFKWDNINPPVFLGLANFVRLFQDPVVLYELWQTLLFTVTIVPMSLVVSLLVANALSKDLPGTAFFRSAFFTPYVTLAVAVALVWRSMFNGKFGPINGLLGFMGIPGPEWLTSIPWVRVVIILMGVWGGFGYTAILLLAGIKSIPRSYYESAQIDGATERTSFLKITLPLITPQIFFVLCTGIIGGLKMFDAVYIFGKGSATVKDGIRTMVFGIFDRAFEYKEMGYASAEAVALFAIIMTITIIQFVAQKKWVNYDY